MGSLAASSMLLPSKLKQLSLFDQNQSSLLLHSGRPRRNHSVSPVMRLFGPAIFEASKLRVVFLGVDDKKHPANLPRTYTLTHSDITAKLTLAISQTINNSQLQGWSNRLYRDEVVAEWKKVKGKMSLHVHCHISGGHFLLDLCAKLRYCIFCKELPVVLKAFAHGDEDLFKTYPELEEALVWVHFHSNTPEFNKVECWGPLKEAGGPTSGTRTGSHQKQKQKNKSNKCPDLSKACLSSKVWDWEVPQPCKEPCTCCFPPVGGDPLLLRPLQQGCGCTSGTHQPGG